MFYEHLYHDDLKSLLLLAFNFCCVKLMEGLIGLLNIDESFSFELLHIHIS